MSEFHERPVLGGRVGNDLEPMLFYDDALPRVSAALIAPDGRPRPDDPPPGAPGAGDAPRRPRPGAGPRGARAAGRRRRRRSASGRRRWPRSSRSKVERGQADPALLAAGRRPARRARSPRRRRRPWRSSGGSGPSPDDADRADGGRGRGSTADRRPVRAAALRRPGGVPGAAGRAGGPRARSREALADPDVEARVAAIRLALDRPGVVAGQGPAQGPGRPGARRTGSPCSTRSAPSKTYADDLRLVGVVSDALVDDNGGVREKALQVIQAHPALVANPAVAEGLRELSAVGQPAAEGDRHGPAEDSAAARAAPGPAADRLDLAFFEAKVLPIFNAMGEDGQNCVGCHRSHTILKMVPPGKDGTWSPEAVRANFRAALRVVNLAQPADSLLLGKPTWEAAEEAEAQSDPTKKAHAGGVRFEPGPRPSTRPSSAASPSRRGRSRSSRRTSS